MEQLGANGVYASGIVQPLHLIWDTTDAGTRSDIVVSLYVSVSERRRISDDTTRARC